MKDEPLLQKLRNLGVVLDALDSASFRKFVADDLERWNGVVQSEKITLEE